METDSLDTSLIVRVLTRDDYKKSKQTLDFLQTSSAKHQIFDLAISETVYVLTTQYGKTRQEAIDLLSFFLTRFSDSFIYNQTLTSLVFPMYLSHPKLSFNDCMLSCYAELHHAEPLFTFDKKLAKQASNAKILA